jgi:hypothetical protein
MAANFRVNIGRLTAAFRSPAQSLPNGTNSASSANPANRAGQGMGGTHTVWTRYRKGIRPPHKSFAIKYKGMAYRGGGME